MALTREEFVSLEACDSIQFGGHLGCYGNCKVIETMPGQQIKIEVMWPPQLQEEYVITWDESKGSCVCHNSDECTSLFSREETYLEYESIRTLAEKWLKSGKITPEDFDRLRKASAKDSSHVAGVCILGS